MRLAGPRWLKSRVDPVPIVTGRSIVSAVPSRGHLTLKLDDGSERSVDHALLGTGYKVDISQYPFLDCKLLAAIRQIDGYPHLNQGFESSVAVGRLLGGPAARELAPVRRYDSGSSASARHVVGQRV